MDAVTARQKPRQTHHDQTHCIGKAVLVKRALLKI
jgi:hypothetical protein